MSCFSKSWHSPVMWAHYADDHKGLCLGFDVKEGMAKEIEYPPAPQTVTAINTEFVEKLWFTKYVHWQYEEEVRLYATVDKREGDFYFKDFDDDLVLREIIIGSKSHLTKQRVRQKSKVDLSEIRIINARSAEDSFKMVEDEKWTEDNRDK